MRYGCQVWGQSNSAPFEKISKLQNRAMRIINFEHFEAASSPIFKTSGILKIENDIELENCLLVHDFLNKKLPHCFETYFTKAEDIHGYPTSNSDLGCLFTPKWSSTRYGLNSITHKCITSWNKFSKIFKQDLSTISRNVVKETIKLYNFHHY